MNGGFTARSDSCPSPVLTSILIGDRRTRTSTDTAHHLLGLAHVKIHHNLKKNSFVLKRVKGYTLFLSVEDLPVLFKPVEKFIGLLGFVGDDEKFGEKITHDNATLERS